MTLPTKSACIVVNRIVGGKRREEKRERVDESDEKLLGGVLGGREVNGRGLLPRRLEDVSCFSQTRPACSRRAGPEIEGISV